MSLPSDKYKKQLLPIKQQLMTKISSYFRDCEFDMQKETVISYPMEFGETFSCRFDTVQGCDKYFKLFMKEKNYIIVMSFDAGDERTVENDIPFLMRLLDYIDMDNRERRNGKKLNNVPTWLIKQQMNTIRGSGKYINTKEYQDVYNEMQNELMRRNSL